MLKEEHLIAPRSRLDAADSEAAEQSKFRNYVRDLILGFNDGVVSVYAVCAGLAGAAFSTSQIAVAGVAAAVAGALSMGLGEYLSTKSQSQYYDSEARREREHIRAYPELETKELREMLEERGYPPDLLERVLQHIGSDEERFVDFMMREEFGIGQESKRSAVAAMFVVTAAFLVAAVLPVFPYAFLPDRALGASSVASIVGLFAAGAAKGKLSGLSMLRSGLEMALLGGAAGLVTYYVGSFFDVQV